MAYRERAKGWTAMALKITIGAALALMALLGYVGFRRDLRRGVMALAGTLLGASLVGFWGEQWGQSMADRFGGDPQQIAFIVNSLVFLFSVLLVGYGGGLLLGPSERASFPRRLAGALLGMLNGALITGYLLRFGTERNPSAREAIGDWLPARAVHDGLPLLFLGFTLAVGLLVLMRAVIKFGGRERPAPARLSAEERKPAASTTGATPTTAPVDDHDVLNKVNDAMRR
jgi:hypothetical protein